MTEAGTAANEHIVEIRYKPNARVLDHRGEWAETISAKLELSQWEIVEHRVDVFAPDKRTRAFVGFSNSGFVMQDTPTATLFPDKAQKFFRVLFELPNFGTTLHVARLGVRSRFCTPYIGTFEQLRDLFTTRYLDGLSGAISTVGRNARLEDVGVHVNFADTLGNFNTVGGPMRDEEFPRYFTKNEGFPKVGAYFDIDYWQKPAKELSSRDVLSTIARLAAAAWERHDAFRALLLGA